MANLNICDLSEDILERIFSNIEAESLPTLTEVCKRFNSVIGSSRQLMDRFSWVEWTEENCKKLEVQALLMSKRKYRHMNISCVELGPDLKHFLTTHATTLTSICFSECSFKSSKLGSALRPLAQNLSEISMNYVNVEVDNEIAPIPFKQLTLTLRFCDISVFGFFAGATTVSYLKLETASIEKKTISTFVLSLDGLKTLNICAGSTLFNDFNECRFQLTTLKFKSNEVEQEQMSQEFWSFIDMQRSTLKKLHLTCLDIDRLDILLSLNLQELSLIGCYLTRDSNPLGENVSIKALHLEDTDCNDNSILLCNIIEKCTGLERIVLDYATFEMNLAIRESNVETLILHGSDCFPMTIPSLKTLTVQYTRGNLKNVVRLVRLNPQLKNLTVPSRFISWPEFVRTIESMNLESLEYE